jgi:hypothetical protein
MLFSNKPFLSLCYKSIAQLQSRTAADFVFLAICLFLFAPAITAQQLFPSSQDCPEITQPKFESDQGTLCRRYNTPTSTFPNTFGTLQTQYASQIIWNLNTGSDVFTGDIDLVGQLTIDQDFTLLNCKVRISPNVRIVVESGVTAVNCFAVKACGKALTLTTAPTL